MAWDPASTDAENALWRYIAGDEEQLYPLGLRQRVVGDDVFYRLGPGYPLAHPSIDPAAALTVPAGTVVQYLWMQGVAVQGGTRQGMCGLVPEDYGMALVEVIRAADGASLAPGDIGLVRASALERCGTFRPRALTGNAIATALLRGTFGAGPLARLRHDQDLLELIFERVRLGWRESVDVDPGPHAVACHPVEFPEFTGINVNMMPVSLGDMPKWLPAWCRPYEAMIQSVCSNIHLRERCGVGYLTIQETTVPAGESQRRPGLHTEKAMGPGSCGPYGTYEPNGFGVGSFHHKQPSGGLYMASSVSGTCNVWDCRATPLGQGSCCEFLRQELDDPVPMRANVLYWMHDSTPHESVPVAATQRDPRAPGRRAGLDRRHARARGRRRAFPWNRRRRPPQAS